MQKNVVSIGLEEKHLENTIDVSVCFIILNYNNAQLTKQCIESILDMDFSVTRYQPFILIVDNASEDNSGDELYSIYESDEQIHIIKNNKNEGFSVGNNIAYIYAKEHLNIEFIITVNSDVIFVQKDFISRLYNLYQEHPFWVAGPDIVVKDRYCHQNPRLVIDGYPHKSQIEKMKCKWEATEKHMRARDVFALKKYLRERYRTSLLLRVYYLIKNIFRDNSIYEKQNENVCLQGPCIIFDRRYCDNNAWLFRPLTFLYLEEQILSLDCYLNNWNTVYFPQLKVEHIDCGSTYNSKLSFSEYCSKKAEQMKRGIESANTYLKYLEESVKVE